MTQYIRHRKKNADGTYEDLIPDIAQKAQGYTSDGDIATALGGKAASSHNHDGTYWKVESDLGSNYTMNKSDFNQAYPVRRKVNTFATKEQSPDGNNIGDYYLYSLGHADINGGYSTILAVSPRLGGANANTNLYIGHFWVGVWKGWNKLATADELTNGAVTKVGTSTVGGASQPIYLNNGVPAALGYTIQTSVPANAKFTDTTYSAGNGLSLSNGAFSLKTGYTSSGKNYKVQLDSNGNPYVNVPWADTDTKVTAVGNHYTPAEDTSAVLSADASSTTAATWNSTSLVTGVDLKRDAKGHVVGIAVDSIKMPANPNSDTKVRQTTLNGSDNVDRAMILAYNVNTTTGNTDNITYRSTKIYANDSTGTVTATKFKGALEGNVTGNCSGSAGSVAWGNVSGKPESFPPSAHTHSTYPLKYSEIGPLIRATSSHDYASPSGGAWQRMVLNEVVVEGGGDYYETSGGTEKGSDFYSMFYNDGYSYIRLNTSGYYLIEAHARGSTWGPTNRTKLMEIIEEVGSNRYVLCSTVIDGAVSGETSEIAFFVGYLASGASIYAQMYSAQRETYRAYQAYTAITITKILQ